MRYLVCTIVGLGLFGFGIAIFDGALYDLLKIGTCASGGPYVSARPCPSGTERYILSLFGGLLAVAVGLGIWAMRGRRPGVAAGGRHGAVLGASLLGWCGLFLSAGIVCLVAALRGGLGPGASTGAWIVAGIFIPMGLIPLLGVLAALVKRRGQSPPSATDPQPAAGGRLPGLPGDEPARSGAGAGRAAAVLATAAGLAVGVWGGMRAADAIRIDLPSTTSVRLPGGGTVRVSAPAGADSVRGGAPESLLRRAQLARVRRVLAGEASAGRSVTQFRLAPGRVNAQVANADGGKLLQIEPDGADAVHMTLTVDLATGPAGGFAPAAIDVRAPERIVRGIARIRAGVTADDVDYMVLTSLGEDLGWVAFLKSGSPRSFLATVAGHVRRANG